MLSIHEFQIGLASLLKNVRERNGLSKFKIAQMLGIDDHTWARYEDGRSSPTVPQFLEIYEKLDEDLLRDVLDLIYPDVYDSLRNADNKKSMREAAIHYFQSIATDRAVAEWNFISFGEHGSNIMPQMEMFTMIDHLPMKYRYAIAEQINTFWQIAEANGELINTDSIMPDVDLFRSGLEKGRQATMDGKNSYTTALNTGKDK